jgi:ATP synthase protein I
MKSENELKKKVELQARRIQKAEKERPTLLAQTIYAGMLGLLIVLPVIGGAYLGNWIDSQLSGYSVRWTTSLIILGVMIGGMNVYLYIRE